MFWKKKIYGNTSVFRAGCFTDPFRDEKGRGKRFSCCLRATASMAAVLAGGMYGGRLRAQELPAGCTESVSGNTGIVTCTGDIDGGIGLSGETPVLYAGDADSPVSVENTDGDGIYIQGTGGLTIEVRNAASTVYGSNDAVSSRNNGGGSISVSVAGDSTGGNNGITAVNTRTDRTGYSLSITASGTVTGKSRDGIDARNYGTGILSVTTAGVSGKNYGIYALNQGTDLRITTTGSVSGKAGAGVYAFNEGSGTLSVTTAGVTGGGYGVKASNMGTDLEITATGLISGGSDSGIKASSAGTGSLSITAAGVSGGGHGIQARNDGKDLEITVTGTVYGKNGDGIYAFNEGAGFLSITTAGVTGGGYGIKAFNMGTDLEITATGSISGDAGNGIYARNDGTGSLTVYASPETTVSSTEDHGMDIRNYNGGALTVTTGSVRGGLWGIRVVNNSGDGGEDPETGFITVTAAGSVYGKTDDGISISNHGSGALFVTAGDVYGGAAGIDVGNHASATDITIVAPGTVTGAGSRGIYASNRGSGDVTVTAGDVSGEGDGIRLVNSGGRNITATVTGSVTGGADGIDINNSHADGSGDSVFVTTSGTVTGKSGDGIGVRNEGSGILSITSADVSGENYGINALNQGTDLEITATGSISGEVGNGIYARNDGTGSLTVYASPETTVSSTFEHGMNIRNYNGGALTVTTGSVTGNGAGFSLFQYNSNDMNEADVTVTAAGSVYGKENDGIRVDNKGTGALFVTTGDVYGGYAGIDVDNGTSATDITIVAPGTVTGAGSRGIYALNRGSGDVTVTAGDVSGEGEGIYLVNSGGGNITATVTGSVTGGTDGIDIDNSHADGSGDSVFVTTSGTVTGKSGDGIGARNEGSGILSITSADVDGWVQGIYARNYGTDLLVTATGSVSGEVGNGIYARNDGTGSLTVYASPETTISSTEDHGMNIRNLNGGALTVTTGSVTGNGAGFRLFQHNSNDMNETGVTVTVSGAVYGKTNDGIGISNHGSGVLFVTTGDVYGGSSGIDVSNSTSATDIVIIASGTVTGADADGIFAHNQGSGGINVTAEGDVTGGNYGVYVGNIGAGKVKIHAGNVYGGNDGIQAYNYGTGLEITATGFISGENDDGIEASNRGAGVLSITTAGVSGENYGIYALNQGTDLEITATGSISGDAGNGIYARNNGTGSLTVYASPETTVSSTEDHGMNIRNLNGGALTVTAGSVTGAVDGIYACQQQSVDSGEGMPDVSVSITGSVSGGRYGIYTAGDANTVSVTIGEGASVSGDMAAIKDGKDSSGTGMTVFLAKNAALEGTVLLNAGDDTFHDDGGEYELVDGGEGTDTAVFSGERHIVTDAGNLKNFEIFTFDTGEAVLSGTRTGLEEIRIDGGLLTLDAGVEADTVTVAQGAAMRMAGSASLKGSLVVKGFFDTGNEPGTVYIDGDFTLGETGVYLVDITGDGQGILDVDGKVELGGTLDISLSGPLSASAGTVTIIDSTEDISGAFRSVSGKGGLLLSREAGINATAVTLSSVITDPADIEGLDVNHVHIARYFLSLPGGMTDDDGSLDALARSVLYMDDAGTLADTLDHYSPEGFDAGLKMMTAAQGYVSRLLYEAPGAGPSGDDAAGRPVRLWGGFSTLYQKQKESAGFAGFSGHVHTFIVGAAVDGPGRLTGRLAAGYSSFDAGHAGMDGDGINGKLYHLAGSISVPFTLSRVQGRMEHVLASARGDSGPEIDTGGGVRNGTAKISTVDWKARMTMQYSWADGAILLEPFLGGGYSRVRQQEVRTGSGIATDLVTGKMSAARGEVEAGADIVYVPRDDFRIHAGASGLWYTGDTGYEFVSGFAGADRTVEPFPTHGRKTDRQMRLEAGASWQHESGFSLSAVFAARAGDLSLYGGGVYLGRSF